MEMRSALPAEENIAACDPCPPLPVRGDAEHLPAPPEDWTATMDDWEGAQQPERDDSPAPGELLRRLNALHLSEPRYSSPRLPLRSHVDARYPEPLSTEESPRRRARSLPWNSIPEVEEDDDSIICCCKLKKKVQFADSLGLCLASIKHFLPSDEPLVPQAVLARLQTYPPTMPEAPPPPLEEEMRFSECPAPAELQARLDEQQVCLEQVSASAWGVSGSVLVKDPEDCVQIKVRYTFNEWLSFLDCPASAAEKSPGPDTQRFCFNLCYPPSTSLLHFAVCYVTSHGQEIWDNNQGANYTVSCRHDSLPEGRSSSLEREESEGPQLW